MISCRLNRQDAFFSPFAGSHRVLTRAKSCIWVFPFGFRAPTPPGQEALKYISVSVPSIQVGYYFCQRQLLDSQEKAVAMRPFAYSTQGTRGSELKTYDGRDDHSDLL